MYQDWVKVMSGWDTIPTDRHKIQTRNRPDEGTVSLVLLGCSSCWLVL